MWGISLELFHAQGIWAMWARCRRAPHDAVPRRRHNAHHDVDEVPRDPMLSELGHAQAARRLADAETVELLVWYVHLVYTHHCMTYDISYLSIHLSIYLYPSIHPSTHIHTVNIIAGRFFV